VTVPDFSDWPEDASYRTRFSIDRQVGGMLRVFLRIVHTPAGRVSLWIKSGGLRLDQWMPGRQVAWLRRTPACQGELSPVVQSKSA
jgi:hypothetical protein